jgi:RNA polymerase sigma factor (sigma-70 family)
VNARDVEGWYRQYGHSVLRRAEQILGNHDEAAEVLQEMFLALVARPDQFAGRSSPSTFLYAITTHACLSRLRKRRNRVRLIDEQIRPWSTDIDPRTPEATAIVRSVLAQLPDEDARAAVYYYIDGLTHAEIAEVLGCSRRHVGDVLSRLARHLEAAREAS